ncbi:hypothetical protein [Azotobacter beijerinckii]|nr:hypothetical protein [Azotobacter beijerinckii]
MDEDVRNFGITLGRAVLSKSWQEVYGMLAPWLRNVQSVESVQKFFEDEYRSTLQANRIEGLHYPEYPEPELGGNGFTKATQLREPISFAGGKVRCIAPEMIDANTRYWMSMKLLCSDEQIESLNFDFFCEVWIAVVESTEGLRAGYWSQGAY